MSNEFKGVKFSSMALPWVPVGHADYRWTNHAETDVTRTWKKYGWTPLELQGQTTTRTRQSRRASAEAVRGVQEASRAGGGRSAKRKMDMRPLLDAVHQP